MNLCSVSMFLANSYLSAILWAKYNLNAHFRIWKLCGAVHVPFDVQFQLLLAWRSSKFIELLLLTVTAAVFHFLEQW